MDKMYYGIVLIMIFISSTVHSQKKNDTIQPIDLNQEAGHQPLMPQAMLPPSMDEIITTIPEILPPSPEASSFVRQGLGTVNKSNGALQTQIPVYEIKIGNGFSFPISLSYSTQGLKSADIGSRVGLGWNLMAGGVITRIIRGVPDELLPRTSIPLPLENNQQLNYRLLTIAESMGDSQADEYTFSVNGLNGKFVIDTNMNARITSAQNCKIKVYGANSNNIIYVNGFVITGPDGAKYTFRNNKEQTQDFSQRGYTMTHDILTTAYFLDRIDLLSGEYIKFNYSSITTSNTLMISQTLTIKKFISSQCGGTYPDVTNYESRPVHTKYQTRYLTSIETSDHCYIYFGYENRGDSTKDNRLTSINISPINITYWFDYFDVAHSGGQQLVKRFLLQKITRTALVDDSPQVFYLDYNNQNSIPEPSAVHQDLMGFYSPNVHALVPNNLGFQDNELPGRGPLASQPLPGTLKSITYPEGGYESYEYERNKISSWVSTENGVFSAAGATQHVSGPYPVFLGEEEGEDGLTYISFGSQISQIASISASVISTSGSANDSTLCNLIVSVYENGMKILNKCIYGYGIREFTVALTPGKSYRMDITVRNSYLTATADLFYQRTITPYILDRDTYGVRIKKLVRFDPVTNQKETKFYTYGSLTDKKWSSIGIMTPVNISTSITKEPCDRAGLAVLYANYNIKTFHSNSINNIYDYNDGNPIYYTSVIESSDSLFADGGTEYTYMPFESGSRTLVLSGEAPIGLPVGQAPTLSGKIAKEVVFDSGFDILRESVYDYEMAINMDNYVPSFYINEKYNIVFTEPDWMDGFDIVHIYYSSNWIRLKRTISNVYEDNNLLSDTTLYYYESFDNVKPKKIVSRNSKGETMDRRIHYATDYPSDVVAQQMVDNNQIEAVMSDSIMQQNILQKYYKIQYKDWFGDGRIVQPEKVYSKESPSDVPTPKILYNLYDVKGNILEVQKKHDLKEVYLWGYDTTYPVARITGSEYNIVNSIVTQAQIDSATSGLANENILRSLMQSLRTNPLMQDAMITTYTYIPFVGISSVTDATGRTIYYEYDGFGRLHIIKDGDSNIIKKIDYVYGGESANH